MFQLSDFYQVLKVCVCNTTHLMQNHLQNRNFKLSGHQGCENQYSMKQVIELSLLLILTLSRGAHKQSQEHLYQLPSALNLLSRPADT